MDLPYARIEPEQLPAMAAFFGVGDYDPTVLVGATAGVVREYSIKRFEGVAMGPASNIRYAKNAAETGSEQASTTHPHEGQVGSTCGSNTTDLRKR